MKRAKLLPINYNMFVTGRQKNLFTSCKYYKNPQHSCVLHVNKLLTKPFFSGTKVVKCNIILRKLTTKKIYKTFVFLSLFRNHLIWLLRSKLVFLHFIKTIQNCIKITPGILQKYFPFQKARIKKFAALYI